MSCPIPAKDASRMPSDNLRPLGTHQPLLPVKTRVIKRRETGILRAA